MKIARRVTVFDASDIEAEGSFWTGLLGGTVHREPHWRSIVVDGEWVMGVQRAPKRPADNPDGDAMFAVPASPAGHPFFFGVR